MTRAYPFSEPVANRLDPAFAEVGLVSRVRMPYGGDAWLVTGYDDVRGILSDGRFSRAAAVGPDTPRMSPEPPAGGSIIMADPPEHTRLRRIVGRAFGTRRVASLRPRVAALLSALVDEMEEHGPPADLVAAIARPLPTLVICELLGVPVDDREKFRGWVDPILSTTAYPPERVREALDEFSDYICDLLDARRETPADDLLSALIHAHDEGGDLTDLELVTLAGTLLVAGHDNTANQIANSVYALLAAGSWPLSGDVDAAVEELLRMLSVGAGVSLARRATEDVEVAGVRIAAGDAVLVSLPAANRDPRVFTDPDTLDLARTGHPHLAFGPGTHHCLGAPLARMELSEVLSALGRRVPGLRLAGEVEWKAGLLARAPVALPVAW
jgi:cytochrome P450